MKINGHQINTVTGDLQGNFDKILECIKQDAYDKVDVSVFPETAISGYCCGSLWDRIDFVRKQESYIKDLVLINKNLQDNQTFIVGYVSCGGINKSGFPKLRNSVACINRGKLEVYHKQLLATTDHHEDKKYFIPGKETKIFNIVLRDYSSVNIGVPICEDSWFENHRRNIPEEMVNMGAEVLISINQSYFYYGKQEVRYNLFQKIAKNNNVPVIMVNSCGLGDILKNIVIYDGGSLVFDSIGNLCTQLPNFKTANLSVYTQNLIPIVNRTVNSKFSEIYDALVFEQKEFFKLCGIPNAQVHLSGGLDSSIVAAIVVDAMGPEHTVFITNPSSLNYGSVTYKYAAQTADLLGCKLYVNPVEGIYQEIKKVDEESFKSSGLEIPLAGYSTMHAVLRSVQAIAANHRFKSGIVSTGNHTENVLGWASFHDIGSIGVHQPIGDMTKLELYRFAKYINDRWDKEIVPEGLFNGLTKPAAELPDAMEDPINYPAQSGICADLIRSRKSKVDIIQEFNRHELNPDFYDDTIYHLSEKEMQTEIDFAVKQMVRSVYKNAQSAPVVIISPRSRGFSSRETLINKYTY
ncbi:MAG: nitrilase-related carbon-nitrogen hydrolase [Candidatus Pacearchaeota archaeon]|jgi:predicted amidohydrolase/NH3-dependent NAD+ synthetase|nr:hypothetical protein [Clostridia bacterium]